MTNTSAWDQEEYRTMGEWARDLGNNNKERTDFLHIFKNGFRMNTLQFVADDPESRFRYRVIAKDALKDFFSARGERPAKLFGDVPKGYPDIAEVTARMIETIKNSESTLYQADLEKDAKAHFERLGHKCPRDPVLRPAYDPLPDDLKQRRGRAKFK